jgi:hypothetical protein
MAPKLDNPIFTESMERERQGALDEIAEHGDKAAEARLLLMFHERGTRHLLGEWIAAEGITTGVSPSTLMAIPSLFGVFVGEILIGCELSKERRAKLALDMCKVFTLSLFGTAGFMGDGRACDDVMVRQDLSTGATQEVTLEGHLKDMEGRYRARRTGG